MPPRLERCEYCQRMVQAPLSEHYPYCDSLHPYDSDEDEEGEGRPEGCLCGPGCKHCAAGLHASCPTECDDQE